VTAAAFPVRRVSDDVGAAFHAFRVGAGQTLAAWPVLGGRSLFYLLIMTVQAALWDRVMAARLPGTIAAELPDGVLVLYVAATEWITLAVPALHLRLEDDIRLGGLEPHLLRPKAYFFQAFAQAMGGGIVRLGSLALTAIAMLALSGRAWPPLEAFAYLVVLGPLGLTVGVLLYALAGLGAFWARRTLPFQLVIQKLMFLMGGLFAPITLYPRIFAEICAASPFAAHLYWAGRQVTAPSLAAFGQGVAWCALWIVLLTFANLGLWRAGLAKVLREGL
jgi:ABC-2 type transport system permease protein